MIAIFFSLRSSSTFFSSFSLSLWMISWSFEKGRTWNEQKKANDGEFTRKFLLEKLMLSTICVCSISSHSGMTKVKHARGNSAKNSSTWPIKKYAVHYIFQQRSQKTYSLSNSLLSSSPLFPEKGHLKGWNVEIAWVKCNWRNWRKQNYWNRLNQKRSFFECLTKT